MRKVKIIRKEVGSKIESDEKVAHWCLEQQLAYYTLLLVPPLEQTKATGPKTAAGVKSEKMGAQWKTEQVEQGAEDILVEVAKTKAVSSLLRR